MPTSVELYHDNQDRLLRVIRREIALSPEQETVLKNCMYTMYRLGTDETRDKFSKCTMCFGRGYFYIGHPALCLCPRGVELKELLDKYYVKRESEC